MFNNQVWLALALMILPTLTLVAWLWRKKWL